MGSNAKPDCGLFFHGSKDDVVPVSMSEKMVDALRAAGGSPRVTLLDDMGHGIGPTVWNRKDLYDWMLQHRLVGKVRRA